MWTIKISTWTMKITWLISFSLANAEDATIFTIHYFGDYQTVNSSAIIAIALPPPIMLLSQFACASPSHLFHYSHIGTL